MKFSTIKKVMESHFADRPNVNTVYLFGSRARGTHRPVSDVDIGIIYFQKPGPTLSEQPFGDEEELSRRLGLPVQITVMNSAPPELVRKKLGFIEECLADLEELARPDKIESDVRDRRFIEHTLQIMLQAVQDIASHIVSDDRLGEPDSNSQLPELLGRHDWIRPDLAKKLAGAIRFRDILVHGYQRVEAGLSRDVLETRLPDLRQFCREINEGLTRH